MAVSLLSLDPFSPLTPNPKDSLFVFFAPLLPLPYTSLPGAFS